MEHQTENVATNRETEIENDSSNETLLSDLEKQIKSKYEIVQQYSHRPKKEDLIMYSVEPFLREVNATAVYTPKFVIIGPIRHYHKLFEQMEMQKWRHLNSFLDRAKMKASCKDFCELIINSEDKIRRCYETIYLRNWDFLSLKVEQKDTLWSFELFIQMVLVDASFIIEIFLKAYGEEGRHENDIFRRDLFLAHNQLPFFILKDIYERAFSGNPNYLSFLHLTCHFFSLYYNQNISIGDIISPNNRHEEYRAKLEGAKHFTDLLRTLQLPYSFQKDTSKGKSFCCKWIKNKVVYFIDLTSSSLLPSSSKKPDESLESGEYLYSAVLLREAGVRFKVSKSRCLLDIEFNPKNGELKIPPLRVDESTESFFRNLMAWEKRYYPHDTYICDYIFLMEYLIKSTEDVDLLVRKRIIINQLGSNKAVETLFNNCCKHITRAEKNSYADIFRKLNAYNAVRHHSWIAILKLQYFSTLWKGVATIAAVILLVLTLIQTIIAVISLLQQ
ncbi:hypothetical protein REPUB_Repub11eG0014300 [Reevesia pubescens]